MLHQCNKLEMNDIRKIVIFSYTQYTRKQKKIEMLFLK